MFNAPTKIINQNMRLRIVSAALMLLAVFAVIFWLPKLFDIFIIFVAVLMLVEWFEMTKSSFIHLLTGLIIIPIPIISCSVLHQIDYNGYLLLTYVVFICSVDSFAMLGGRKLQGPKLAPTLSPNKTWSGLICGIIGSNLVLYLLTYIPGYLLPIELNFSLMQEILLISCFGVLEQLSDLVISSFKRKFKIKDSGKLIPGHGGILDRLDGMILTLPAFLLMVHYL